ncbi:hypothetical protein [Metallosphaera hakonensis]|nr:hypothetical protein [Metallosphaera hakonensis]AWR98435.2 hypothetical protein DFR87_00475 [Metallosphaera hakonensis JCM 8857 = DSM 7519]
MLALTLTATLSLSLINALDQGKGSLFPRYFYIYRGMSRAVMAMLIMGMDSILPIALLIDPIFLGWILSLVLVLLMLNHAIMKAIVGSLLHYTGGFRPSILGLGRWYVSNYLLSAEPVYVMVITSFGYLNLLLFVATYISLRVITWILLLFMKNEGVKRLCSLNYDRVRLIVALILTLSVILRGVS